MTTSCVGTHRALEKGLSNIELQVDPRITAHRLEIDKDRIARHARQQRADLAGKTGNDERHAFTLLSI